MKPARERFFPTPSTPRAGSGPAFITNPDNPPRRSHSSNSGEQHRTQDSVVLSALDKLQNTSMNRPLTQIGYPAFMRKLTMGANALNAGRIIRPGTAEPRLSEDRGMNARIENGNIPLIAPTPKKYHHITPPFALPDGPFGSESLDVSRENHSSKSPDNLIEGREEETFKIPFPKKMKVHQRVPGQPEPSQYQPKLHRRGEPENDSGERDGSSLSLHRNKKRMREVDEIEEPEERNAKRFKSHEAEEDDKMSCHESRSPRPDRQSSTLSSPIGSYHGRPNVGIINSPPAQRLQLERQENLDLNPTIQSNRTRVGLPGRRRSEPIGLDKLLGPGSNDLLDQYADRYEGLLKNWSECSVAEWKAGAEEISVRFTMMLDFAKDHLDKKLKAYSGLTAVLDSHCEILRERSDTMDVARKKVVKDGCSVLG